MRAHRKICSILLFLFSVYGTVFAQNNKPDPCANAMTQMEMNVCSANEAQKADEHLNRVYGNAMENLQRELTQAGTDLAQMKYSQTAIDDLKAAETAWIKYRDLNCKAAGQQFEGGTIRPSVENMCMSTTTDHRIQEIKQAYERDGRKLE